MNELTEQYWMLAKFAGICAFLYGWGGTEGSPGKWLRRWLMPVIAFGAMAYFSKVALTLAAVPLAWASLSMGYGGVALGERIRRRLAFGSANAFVFCALFIYSQAWMLACWQMVLVPASYILFGVWNPFKSARIEESVLGGILVFLPILAS
jgi:hypothetical protein